MIEWLLIGVTAWSASVWYAYDFGRIRGFTAGLKEAREGYASCLDVRSTR